MRQIAVVLVSGLLPLTLVYAQNNPHTLYKWTDDKGNVHYSDHLPSEAVKQERDVLDSHGEVRKVLPRQKTAAELQAEEEQRKAAQEAADYDKSLLQTYGNVADIEHARDDRLTIFDSQMQRVQKQVDETQQKLSAARARATEAKAGGKPPNEELEQQVSDLDKELADRYDTLAKLSAERQHTTEQFARDIQRFKQLKSESAAAKPNG